MAPKIFVTGATGYVGGDALHLIAKKHPDWGITCLVRNSDKGAKVAGQYPSVRLVYGDLDSAELISAESANADIIFNFADCDHVGAAEAIAKGASSHSTDNPVYWIHTSGTGILCWETSEKGAYGEALGKEYNDWDGVTELTSLPDKAMHRNVDKIVLAASAARPDAVKTAIVCPPTIYGQGRGPDNQRSMQLPMACQQTLKQKKGFVVGSGTNVWTQSHIEDLSEIYVLLGEAAAAGGGPATWGAEGYYLTDNGAFTWGDVCREIAKVAYQNGLIPSGSAESISLAEADEISPRLKYMIGANSRGVAIRARKLLGWKPDQPTLLETVPQALNYEAKALGLIQGHAEKAA